jgi:hypothetical protein
MGSHLTAAATGTAVATAMPPVLADTAAAALLALGAPPPVLADAAAAAVLAVSGCAAARGCLQRPPRPHPLLALAALSPVLAETDWYHRTPCTGSADARARRCRYHRSPCSGCAAARACTHSRCCHRTPCTCCAAGRACRGHYRPLLTQGISPAHEDRAYLSGPSN